MAALERDSRGPGPGQEGERGEEADGRHQQEQEEEECRGHGEVALGPGFRGRWSGEVIQAPGFKEGEAAGGVDQGAGGNG